MNYQGRHRAARAAKNCQFGWFLVGLLWFGMVGRGYVMNVGRGYVMNVSRGYVMNVVGSETLSGWVGDMGKSGWWVGQMGG